MSKHPEVNERLLEKANTLPLCPGVYIMRDSRNKVIYVGKSKKLKNRVSQYFQNSKKNTKTSKMLDAVEDFEYILCQTEIEALTLENALIKQYTPKYNIKLKDAKSYPYIKITSGEYPKIVFTRKRLADKARYFGPFSGTATVFSVLDIIHKALGIPRCKRSFPKEIGKERPCMYYQMKQCCGVCTGTVTPQDYDRLIRCAADILRGHTAQAIGMLEEQMRTFSDAEQYEAAARCRDTIKALRSLHEKQHVVADPDTNLDIFALYTDDVFSCLSTMYIRDGAVTDKNDFMLRGDAMTDSGTLTAFLVDFYLTQSYIPKQILLSFELEESDRLALEELLSARAEHKVAIHRPERGAMRALCQTLAENAEEQVRQSRINAQKDESVLLQLAEMLALEVLPQRIEAYDISNIGTEHITGGMVVFVDGKPQKSEYRNFSIRTVTGTDDYGSMREMLKRRLQHLKEDQTGSFSHYPDLILVDGGRTHVSAVQEVMEEEGLSIPVFGMVKDEYHKTRALCTEREKINIARYRTVFMLIYRIQEEVHRYTVGKTTQAKRRTIKHSSLERIDGIGPIKAKKLLGAMRTLSAIKQSSEEEISAVEGISAADAKAVYRYFHESTENTTERKRG
ncbi:MAG: excinuclease ABC subunit UvrC [Ruminococcaceae bacterium]|nr:excinuclease ABC subunit UvrC [Oscillospiraceae bacterium]